MGTNLFYVLCLLMVNTCTVCFSQGKQLGPCAGIKKVYYLSKSGKDSPDCLKPDTYLVPCASLLYLMSHIYSCSNFVILDDEIVLEKEVFFDASWVEIGIVGNHTSGQQVAIHCEDNGGLLFQNSRGALIENLRFDGCSFDVSRYLSATIGSSLSSNQSSIMLLGTSGVHISRCSFENHLGSAILLIDVIGTTNIEESTFTGNKSLISDNESRSGGIVMRQSPYSSNNSIVCFQSCNFSTNLNVEKDTQCHDSDFREDTFLFRHGGAIDINLVTIEGTVTSILIVDCNFDHNRALGGGAVSIFFIGDDSHNNVSILSSNFSSNSACVQGGAVLYASDKRAIGYDTNLQGTLTSFGYFQLVSCNFSSNYAFWGGGLAVYLDGCDSYMNIHFDGSTWENNTADSSGFAVGLNGLDGAETLVSEKFRIIATLSGNCTFKLNHAAADSNAVGAVSVDSAQLTFGYGLTSFEKNAGTALLMKIVSRALFYGDVSFRNNSGVKGGAILLRDDSYMYINSSSTIVFDENSAYVMGGAIYSKVTTSSHCVFDFEENNSTKYKVSFTNNRAYDLDQSVFVQNAEACKHWKEILLHGFKYSPSPANQIIFPPDNVKFSILPSNEGDSLHVMLGEKFYLKPVNVSDIFGNNSTGIGYLRITPKDMNSIHLTLRGPSTISFDSFTASIEFFIEGPRVYNNTSFDIDFFFDRVSTYRVGSTSVSLTVIPCRLGYEYSIDKEICECVSNESDKVRCPADGQKLCVKYHYWYSSKSKTAIPCPAQNCWYMYGQCPHKSKYCSSSTDYCSIEHSDDVCWDGRGGLLCSLCASNHSFTFAAFECANSTNCSSKNTGLLMLALIVYWIIFAVAVLIVLSLNLSVGSGFMYGIVYYFSVVTIYTSSSALFSNLWLRILIYISMAITQLDPELLGYMFRTCFAQSWNNPLPHQLLRYATPLFVISLILAVIFISRYCRLPKYISLAENSPIHAICMLILFSYTSLSITNFKILIPMNIEGELRVRIAPTVPYFHNEDHIPYALVALCVELFISLPICFFFLFSTCIARHVNLVKFRLKPILDEFQACYRPECRWFAGFYFLARQVVYLTNGVVAEILPQSNSTLVTVNVLVLIIHTSFQPYQKKWLNILDTILLTDIVLLSMSSVSLSDREQVQLTNRFIHNNALPYALILIPTFYLTGALGFIYLKKKWTSLRRCSCFSKLCARIEPSQLSLGASKTSVAASEIDERERNSFKQDEHYDDSYYRDDGVREPLLEEFAFSDEQKQDGWVYGSVSPQQSGDITSSSLRVSNMKRFPPAMNKSSTN